MEYQRVPTKEWHKNGKLEIQANYINGEKEGSYKEWHDNGRLHIQTSYVNGEKDGSYKYWSYDGDYYYTKKYRSGVEYQIIINTKLNKLLK